jgi:hypothetical protein
VAIDDDGHRLSGARLISWIILKPKMFVVGAAIANHEELRAMIPVIRHNGIN